MAGRTTRVYTESSPVAANWVRADSGLASRDWVEFHNDDDQVEVLVQVSAGDPGGATVRGFRILPLGTFGPEPLAPGLQLWVRAVGSDATANSGRCLELAP